jgi:hypothetical protein
MAKAPYDTKPGNFPYCARHNRLYVHPVVGWLTPARPQELLTFQALCDECKKEALCNLGTNSINRPVPVAIAS